MATVVLELYFVCKGTVEGESTAVALQWHPAHERMMPLRACLKDDQTVREIVEQRLRELLNVPEPPPFEFVERGGRRPSGFQLEPVPLRQVFDKGQQLRFQHYVLEMSVRMTVGPAGGPPLVWSTEPELKEADLSDDVREWARDAVGLAGRRPCDRLLP
jgi:hypothetical protein